VGVAGGVGAAVVGHAGEVGAVREVGCVVRLDRSSDGNVSRGAGLAAGVNDAAFVTPNRGATHGDKPAIWPRRREIGQIFPGPPRPPDSPQQPMVKRDTVSEPLRQ